MPKNYQYTNYYSRVRSYQTMLKLASREFKRSCFQTKLKFAKTKTENLLSHRHAFRCMGTQLSVVLKISVMKPVIIELEFSRGRFKNTLTKY